jgi:hypothetical protein
MEKNRNNLLCDQVNYKSSKQRLEKFLDDHNMTINENGVLMGLEHLTVEEMVTFQNLNEIVKKAFFKQSEPKQL